MLVQEKNCEKATYDRVIFWTWASIPAGSDIVSVVALIVSAVSSTATNGKQTLVMAQAKRLPEEKRRKAIQESYRRGVRGLKKREREGWLRDTALKLVLEVMRSMKILPSPDGSARTSFARRVDVASTGEKDNSTAAKQHTSARVKRSMVAGFA